MKTLASKFNTGRNKVNIKDCDSCEQVFCSYSLKTLMFWKCEDNPEGYWRQKHLIDIIEELILSFCERVIDKECPNFFLRHCNNWYRMSNCDCLDINIENLVSIVETKATIIEHVLRNPIAKDSKFSMESLNASSRQILFEISGVISSFNVVGISEILPFHEFSRLSQDMDVLCRIVSLQRRHSDQFDSGSTNSLIAVIEKLFPTPSELAFMKSDALELLPLSAMSLSLTELVGVIVRYCKSWDPSNLENGFETPIQTLRSSEPVSAINISLTELLSVIVRYYTLWISSKFEQNLRSSKPVNALKDRISCVLFSSCFQLLNMRQLMNGILKEICHSACSLPYFSIAAYRANFYYVHARDASRALRQCHRELRRHSELSSIDLDIFCVLLTNNLTEVYDNSIQAIIGFFTLLKSMLVPSDDKSAAEHFKVELFIPSYVLIRYIQWRCMRNLRRKSRRVTDRLTVVKMLPTLAFKFSQKYCYHGDFAHITTNRIYAFA